MKMCRFMIVVGGLLVACQAQAMMRWSQGLRLVNDPYISQILQGGLKRCPNNCPSRTCTKKDVQSAQNLPSPQQEDIGHVWNRLAVLKAKRGVAQFKDSIAVSSSHKSDMSYYADLLTQRTKAAKKNRSLEVLFLDCQVLLWAAKRARDPHYVEHAYFGASKPWAQTFEKMGEGYRVLTGFMDVAQQYKRPMPAHKEPVSVRQGAADWEKYKPGC